MKRICLILCLAVLLTACAAREAEPTSAESVEVIATREREQETVLYILMYHSVVRDGVHCNDYMVTQETLRGQLQWLADEGYTTVLPSQIVSGEELPEKAVLLSFDDGYADNYELAFPLLREFGCKAVVSVVTSYIEEGDPAFLTWEMCREMVDSGLVEIGSHTHSLHALQGIRHREGETQAEYEARVFPDIQRSIDLIEERLGRTPDFLAYPHGIADEWAFGFIHERFPVTVLSWSGGNPLSCGLTNLRRYNVCQTTDLSEFLPAS